MSLLVVVIVFRYVWLCDSESASASSFTIDTRLHRAFDPPLNYNTHHHDCCKRPYVCSVLPLSPNTQLEALNGFKFSEPINMVDLEHYQLTHRKEMSTLSREGQAERFQPACHCMSAQERPRKTSTGI